MWIGICRRVTKTIAAAVERIFMERYKGIVHDRVPIAG